LIPVCKRGGKGIRRTVPLVHRGGGGWGSKGITITWGRGKLRAEGNTMVQIKKPRVALNGNASLRGGGGGGREGLFVD